MLALAKDTLKERGETVNKDSILNYLFSAGRSDSEVVALELEFSKWLSNQSL